MILNIYLLRKFKEQEREFFLKIYDQLLILEKDTPISRMINLTEYKILSAYNLLITEEELIAYKRDNTIDEILDKNNE